MSVNNLSACPPGASNSCPAWDMGAVTPVAQGGDLIILDFGSPCEDPSTSVSGVQMFGSRICTADSSLVPVVQAFISGYEATHGSGTPPSIIAAGTSNSLNAIQPNGQLTTAQMQTVGAAFYSNLVSRISVASLGAPLTPWGAIDAEEAGDGNWYGPGQTRAFVDGFGAASGHGQGSFPCNTSSSGMLADFGDAVYLQGQWNPPGGWTAADIYHVAWGASVACAVPEIYNTINAQEWQSLSNWAVSQGLPPITFTAAMSEDGVDGTLSAAGSWDALQQATGQGIPYLTTVTWSIPPNLSPPTPIPLAPNLARYYAGSLGHWVTTGPVTTSFVFPYGQQETTLGELSSSSASGLQPLYSCSYGSVHFISLLSSCEGHTLLELDGYSSTSPVPNIYTTPIFRCRVMSNNDHFVSLSSNCEGQTSEGPLGYIKPVGGLTRYYNDASHWSSVGTASTGYFAESVLGNISTASGSGLVPLYSCFSNGYQFTSPSASCEGQTYYGLLGYVSAAPIQGSTSLPLYRCYLSPQHFDTTSTNCEGASSAIRENLLGYVVPSS